MAGVVGPPRTVLPARSEHPAHRQHCRTTRRLSPVRGGPRRRRSRAVVDCSRAQLGRGALAARPTSAPAVADRAQGVRPGVDRRRAGQSCVVRVHDRPAVDVGRHGLRTPRRRAAGMAAQQEASAAC